MYMGGSGGLQFFGARIGKGVRWNGLFDAAGLCKFPRGQSDLQEHDPQDFRWVTGLSLGHQ